MKVEKLREVLSCVPNQQAEVTAKFDNVESGCVFTKLYTNGEHLVTLEQEITTEKKKLLIVVDMQNDFITGSLGTNEAQIVVPRVKHKIEECFKETDIVFTQDVHFEVIYLAKLEGRHLPVKHCIAGTWGAKICDELESFIPNSRTAIKSTFAYPDWSYFLKYASYDEIELCGVCTDICVISNALVLKGVFPEVEITVDASCCAGTTPEKHKAALEVMKSCQINITNEGV